jgi:hypothetical protein
MALQKKTKRLMAYTAILGGCAVLALGLFTISQFEKAKYQASISNQLMADNKYTELIKADENALTDESSKYHDAAVYWDEVLTYFINETDANSAKYKGTAIPAYVLSMATLVAFGLILKHAEKAKEKEDEEVVKG